MPSDADIEKAFRDGDGDSDDGLSVSEAEDALKSLTGKSISSSEIKITCASCGISTSSEMKLSEFKELVKRMEEDGTI